MIQRHLTLLFKTLILCFILNSFSGISLAYDFSSGVFEFQQKLAKKGNPEAQYKLGNMYENGQGVKVDLNAATTWYKKSAAQNNAAAKMRLTYVDIKRSGYNKAKHKNWLKKLQQDAAAKDGESLLLLATMHKKGIVVKKNLNKSASLFKNASIRNVPGAEAELEAVNSLIYNNKSKQQQKLKAQKAKQEQTQIEQAKKEKARKNKTKKDKQLVKNRKDAEQRKKQQAAQKRAERNRINEQDQKAREAAETKRREQARKDEQRRAALAAEQAKAKTKKQDRVEGAPLIDKSKCKGKKARFLTMCR